MLHTQETISKTLQIHDIAVALYTFLLFGFTFIEGLVSEKGKKNLQFFFAGINVSLF